MLKTDYTHDALEVLMDIAQDTNAADEIRLEAARTILMYAVDTREEDNG